MNGGRGGESIMCARICACLGFLRKTFGCKQWQAEWFRHRGKVLLIDNLIRKMGSILGLTHLLGTDGPLARKVWMTCTPPTLRSRSSKHLKSVPRPKIRVSSVTMPIVLARTAWWATFFVFTPPSKVPRGLTKSEGEKIPVAGINHPSKQFARRRRRGIFFWNLIFSKWKHKKWFSEGRSGGPKNIKATYPWDPEHRVAHDALLFGWWGFLRNDLHSVLHRRHGWTLKAPGDAPWLHFVCGLKNLVGTPQWFFIFSQPLLSPKKK